MNPFLRKHKNTKTIICKKLEYDEGEEKTYLTDPLNVLSHVYKSGDTILYSMIMIAIHVSQNPYFAFTLHNLSSNPCTDLINTAVTGTNATGTNVTL